MPWWTRTRAGISASSVERDVEPVARRERARRDERVAAAELGALDARERDRDPLPRLRPLDRAVVHLDAADAHVASRRLDAQLVALAERARPERARRDRADPAQREHAVDVQACRGAAAGGARAGGDLRERRAQLVEPGAGAGAAGHDRRAGDELLGLGARELGELRVDGVGLRQRDDAALDPEQAQDREVLVRLRARALARVDHEQEEVDPGRAGDHRPHEPLVAGHVDERQLRPVRQLERRVAEVDRDAALLLGRQPVGVLARQRLDERRLAVVDVARGADGQWHDEDATASRAGRRRAPASEPGRR